jgi:hypothetical protein
VRHSNTIGGTRCLHWVLLLCVSSCTACLNPMPEEFPSEREPQGEVATGAGGRDANYSESPNEPPSPTAPGAVIDLAPGAEAEGDDPGSPGEGGIAAPDGAADAGVPFAADAGGPNDGNP